METYSTTEEVAERYRTSANTVRYWHHIGYGPQSIKVGRRRLYPESELERFDADLRSEEGQVSG